MRAAFLRGFRNVNIAHVPGQQVASVESVQPSSAAITQPSGAITVAQLSDANEWTLQPVERVNGDRSERVR
jgi:hypothetical protein